MQPRTDGPLWQRLRDTAGRPAELLVDGRAVAPAEVAATWRQRGRGLLGRDGLEGAYVIWPASSVHTVGMRFAIDVACCRADGTVASVHHLRPTRATRPRPRARLVVEAAAGSFERWGLTPGSVVSVVPVATATPPS